MNVTSFEIYNETVNGQLHLSSFLLGQCPIGKQVHLLQGKCSATERQRHQEAVPDHIVRSSPINGSVVASNLEKKKKYSIIIIMWPDPKISRTFQLLAEVDP